MKSVTISLTEKQHRRLAAAAAFIGAGVTIEELILANAVARLDGWEIPERSVRAELRNDVETYAREMRAARVDLSAHELNIGAEMCDHAAKSPRPTKISFELEPAIAERLRGVLAKVDVPESEIAWFAREHLESLAEEGDESFIAQGYAYPDRKTAARVASRFFSLYRGVPSMPLNYHEGGEIVSCDFPNTGKSHGRPVRN